MSHSIHLVRLSLSLLLIGGTLFGWLLGFDPGGPRAIAAGSSAAGRRTRGRKPPPSFAETFASSAARSIGSRLGREIVRGVLGSLFRGR